MCNEASSAETTENDWDELAHVEIKLDCLFFQLEDQCESWLTLAKENKLGSPKKDISLHCGKYSCQLMRCGASIVQWFLNFLCHIIW